MAAAQRAVYGRDSTWYFLHMNWETGPQRPWVARQDDLGRVVSVPATVPDLWWNTIGDAHADPAQIARRLYAYTLAAMDAGGIPAALTHWQSLFSNGLGTGLQALDEYARLLAEDGQFRWQRCSELAAAVAG